MASTEKTAIPTRCSGAGMIISDLFQGKEGNGRPFVNFLVRADNGPILRLQFWGVGARQFADSFPTDRMKGLRIGFKGILTGTYDEKPTVAVELNSIKLGEHE